MVHSSHQTQSSIKQESPLFINVNLVITQKVLKQPKVHIRYNCQKYITIFKLFANRMVNGILPILQSVEKDVDCPTHRKSLTLNWLEVITEIFPGKAETDYTILTVSIKNFFSVERRFRRCLFLMRVWT